MPQKQCVHRSHVHQHTLSDVRYILPGFHVFTLLVQDAPYDTTIFSQCTRFSPSFRNLSAFLSIAGGFIFPQESPSLFISSTIVSITTEASVGCSVAMAPLLREMYRYRSPSLRCSPFFSIARPLCSHNMSRIRFQLALFCIKIVACS